MELENGYVWWFVVIMSIVMQSLIIVPCAGSRIFNWAISSKQPRIWSFFWILSVDVRLLDQELWRLPWFAWEWRNRYPCLDASFFVLLLTPLSVTDAAILDTSVHAADVHQQKVEELLRSHAADYPDTPLFMYYAMQIIHKPLKAPQRFLDRCTDFMLYFCESYFVCALQGVMGDHPSISNSSTAADWQAYCALNVMLDEAIANLTCTLAELGMGENTVLIVASDNGGFHMFPFLLL